VRSHLLRESAGPVDRSRSRSILIRDVALPDLRNSQEKSWSIEGSAMTCGFALIFAWMTKWIAAGSSIITRFWRLISLSVIVFIAYEVVSASTGRQRLRSLRHKALTAIESLLSNFEALDNTSSAAINFIQEVEAVSRGYHL
jgi:hypothetical protein